MDGWVDTDDMGVTAMEVMEDMEDTRGMEAIEEVMAMAVLDMAREATWEGTKVSKSNYSIKQRCRVNCSLKIKEFR